MMLISGLFLVTCLNSATGYTRTPDHFSELIQAQISVMIDDIRLIHDARNSSYPRPTPTCKLSIHRNLCSNAAIASTETIGWNTKICFKWSCENATNYVMRIENCWTGSIHNPIYLIDEKGCSLERNMIRSPRYEHDLLHAFSLGWLSVRLVGVKYIRLSCAARMCHICDDKCSDMTPPSLCADQTDTWDVPNIWNDTEAVEDVCSPAQIVSKVANKGAAAMTEVDAFWLAVVVIVGSLLFR